MLDSVTLYMTTAPLPAFLPPHMREGPIPDRERVIEAKRKLLKVYLDEDLDLMSKILYSSECYTGISQNLYTLRDKAVLRDRFAEIRNRLVTGDVLLQDTLMQMVERLDTLL